MAKAKKQAKDKGQQDAPIGERMAGDEIREAHEAKSAEDLGPVIEKGFARLYELDKDLDAKTLRHLEPLRQDRRDAWKALKSESGIERVDLEVDYRKYKRLRELEDFEDQDHAAVVRENIRRLWQATKRGETLSFLDAVDGMPAKQKEKIKSARQEGYRDFGLGMRFDQCPYDDAVNREAWQAGFLAAKETWDKAAPPTGPREPPAEATAH